MLSPTPATPLKQVPCRPAARLRRPAVDQPSPSAGASADNCGMTPHPVRRTGFTLIEMLIVLAIAAILAALAWPAFTTAINKSRRADAMSALAQISQSQERWRANNTSYQSTLANLVGASASVSPGNHYDLSMVASSVSGTGYKANATVKSSSAQIADTNCQVLQVEMSGGNIIYRSGPDASVANGTPDPCWVR